MRWLLNVDMGVLALARRLKRITMKKVDMTTRAFGEHVANCPICAKIKVTRGPLG